MQAWSAATVRLPKDTLRPPGVAHTRASGPWPLRILLIGCGVAVGEGVLTHDLAVPGHLGRILAVGTARGVDIDVIVDPEMTPTTALAALSRIRVSHYDAIVVMLGAADAAQLTPEAAWSDDFRRLLHHIRETASAHAQTFLVTPPCSEEPPAARLLPRAITWRHARRLTAEMAAMCASTTATTLVPLTAEVASPGSRRRSTEVFREFSRQISAPMSRELTLSAGSSTRRVEVVNEIARQRAVDELGVIDEAASERLDRITALARKAFGVNSAAVSIVDKQWALLVSRQNIDMTRTPRSDAMCAVAITGHEALVVKDASIDPRFADHPLVVGEPHIRFYAGYPIEALNGERVGTLCLMHPEPMDFTEVNLIQLRTLALFAQDELWSAGYHDEREFGQRTADGRRPENN